MKAVIMAAGKSTRTHPLTLTRPKPLLTIANKTILEHQLDALYDIVDEAVIIVGYMKEMIKTRFGNKYGDLKLSYIEQTEQLGTGHAILQCADVIHEPFLALNGDDIFDDIDLASLARSEQAALAKTVINPLLFGNFQVDDRKRLLRLVEKPKEIFSYLANTGAYKFTPRIFEILRTTQRSERNEIEITSAIQTLLAEEEFFVVESQGYWLPIAYPWHLLDANTYLLDHEMRPEIYGDVNKGAHISGNVVIGRGTEVRAGAVIDGPAIIGENCEIGPNCWIRPGTTIGNDCKVGQGSEIKNSILMDGAKAPHQNYVGDSILGEGVNLGCGTVIANYRHDKANHQSKVNGELVDTGRRKFGAIIGDHVHTGIHTTIYPGRKLWPNTKTLPAQVVMEDLVS